MCCFTILLHVISGFFFNDTDFVNSEAAAWLEDALVVVTLLTLSAVVGLFLLQAAELQFQVTAASAVTRIVAASVSSFQNELVRARGSGDEPDDGTSCALIDALDQLADQRELQEGDRVVHASRGPGRIKDIIVVKDQDQNVGKVVVVKFDNGEQHHYSAKSAQKLKSVGCGNREMVKFTDFGRAIRSLSSEGDASSLGVGRSLPLIEAIYLILRVAAGESDLSAASDNGVPMALVSTPSIAQWRL
jgi:hypothetical protein